MSTPTTLTLWRYGTGSLVLMHEQRDITVPKGTKLRALNWPEGCWLEWNGGDCAFLLQPGLAPKPVKVQPYGYSFVTPNGKASCIAYSAGTVVGLTKRIPIAVLVPNERAEITLGLSPEESPGKVADRAPTTRDGRLAPGITAGQAYAARVDRRTAR